MSNLFLNYNHDNLLLDSDLFNKIHSLSKTFIPISLINNDLFVFVVDSRKIVVENYNIEQKIINNDFFNEKIVLINNYDKWRIDKKFSKEIPTRSIVDFILTEALIQKVSDIHFNINDVCCYVVRFKIHTILKDFCELTKEQFDSILIYFKILSSLDPSNKILPKSSCFEKMFRGEIVDFRLSTHPTFLGERFVVRILSKKNVIDYRNLGFNDETLDIIKKVIDAPSGLVIFTGPTNSGKTTLIHSILKEIAKQNISIMTLEDPVEYRVPGIIQSPVSDMGMNFHEGMKSILRQDPDVIFLGEIRDEHLAKMAIQAALTGHKVLTTLHAYSSKGAVTRLFDMGISNVLLGECIFSVFSQRLIKNKDSTGIVSVVDACFFDENIKNSVRNGNYDCIKNNLIKNAQQYIEKDIVLKEEVEKILGF